MNRCSEELIARVMGYLSERFGIPIELFEGRVFYQRPGGRVYMGPNDKIEGVAADSAGILIARVHRTVKPSSCLLQLFGSHVTRNGIILTREQALACVAGKDVMVHARQLEGARPGYVLLTYGDIALGCGLLRDTTIHNVLPKATHLDLAYL